MAPPRALAEHGSNGLAERRALPCPVYVLLTILTIECLYWHLVYVPPSLTLHMRLQLSYEELLERERMLEYSKKKKSGG